MSNLADAADHIHALAAKYEPLVTVSKLLKEIGGLDVHVKELTTTRDKLATTVWELNDTHATKCEEHKVLLDAIESDLVRQAEQSARYEALAQEQIKELFANAELEAAAAAKVVYDSKMDEVHGLDRQVEAARVKLLSLTAHIDALVVDRDLVIAQKDEAVAGLAEVTRTIEQLSKFGSVGGV